MEENSCFAIVKPPPCRSWIRDLSSNAGSRMVKIGRHYYIHGLIIEGHATSITVNRQKVKQHIFQSDWRGICVADASLHEEESDDQHRRDVADSFNIFDEINAPAVQAKIQSHHLKQDNQRKLNHHRNHQRLT
eukprot:4773864-Amphidinium_carterae.1